MHLVKWETVCQEKSKGGLSIRRSTSMNIAFLAKLGWKLENGDSALWAQMLLSKYSKGDNFLNFKPKSNSSHTWRSIQSSKTLARKDCARLIGNGVATSFWV